MTSRDFRIVAGKGFTLNLPNGITVSVQWGPGNYTDSDVRNKECIAPREAAANDENWSANTAECAAYMTDSPMGWVAVPGYTGPSGDVVGWLNVGQMLDFINKAAGITLEVEDSTPSDQYPILPGQQEFKFNDA